MEFSSGINDNQCCEADEACFDRDRGSVAHEAGLRSQPEQANHNSAVSIGTTTISDAAQHGDPSHLPQTHSSTRPVPFLILGKKPLLLLSASTSLLVMKAQTMLHQGQTFSRRAFGQDASGPFTGRRAWGWVLGSSVHCRPPPNARLQSTAIRGHALPC